MKLQTALLLSLLLAGCGSGGLAGRAVGSEVTITLRLDLQGTSTIMPANSSRDESFTLKQVSGKLVAADEEWLAVEVTQGPGQVPRTTYIRQDSVVAMDSVK